MSFFSGVFILQRYMILVSKGNGLYNVLCIMHWMQTVGTREISPNECKNHWHFTNRKENPVFRV